MLLGTDEGEWMGGTSSEYNGHEKFVHNCSKMSEDKKHLQNLTTGGKLILTQALWKWSESEDWIDYAQTTIQWWSIVNSVMYSNSVPKRQGIFWPFEWLLASQEFFFM